MRALRPHSDTGTTGATLDTLCDLRLHYRPDQTPFSARGERPGRLLASGDGTASGRINGHVRWDLYESTGDRACETSFAGLIVTDDGATIRFDTRGYGIVPDPAEANRWTMVSAVQFRADDERYRWVDAVLAVWHGEFDMQTLQHRYRVLVEAPSTDAGRRPSRNP